MLKAGEVLEIANLVKRGRRVVHGNVELTEKLGRNDLCPCGCRRRFQSLLHAVRGV
jgi:uncharacterized protein YecA (UPF0149 family)